MDLEPTTAQPNKPQDELVWILNQVDEAIALFAPDHRLIFFNLELVRLWQLDASWLQTEPNCHQLIHTLAQQNLYPTTQLERLRQALTKPGIGKIDFELEQTNGIGYKANISLSPEGRRLLCLRLLNPSLSADAVSRSRAVDCKLELDGAIAELQKEIQKRQQIQAALTNREERLRLLQSVVVHANDSIVITEASPIDAPGPRILYVNKAFTRLTGYTPEEVVGKTPRILQGPKTNRETLKRLKNSLKTWEPSVVELINYRKDRSQFWVEMSIVPVADHTGWYTHWVAIQRDITQRKLLEEELLKTLQKEKELSELRSRFISTTSHEFRTPLTTILSSAELLEYYSDGWTEAERLEQLHLIQNTVQHMTHLLEDILLIGKAEAGSLKPKLMLINCVEFCRKLVAEFQVGAGSQHHLVFQHPPALPLLHLDRKLVRQILSNLLSNAIKYSPAGKTVWLKLALEGEQLIFSIQDEGIGIPPEDQHNLFEFFYRAKNAELIPGTGLGLSIVKKCVDICSGEIRCQSAIGQGTVFQVLLPTQLEDEETPME